MQATYKYEVNTFLVVNLTLIFLRENARREILLYYVHARYYDPRTSIWYGVDPMAEKYPNKTPYHYCSNSPIVRIDPNGEDDYFSDSGQFIGKDNAKTDFVRIVNDEKITDKQREQLQAGTFNNKAGEKVSDMITDKSLSKSAIINIVNHYDKELGQVEGKSPNIVKGLLVSEKTIMQAESNNKLRIGVTKDGDLRKINPLLNTASNIKNTLVHEYKHFSDYARKPLPDNSVHRELRAIEAQRAHPTWENTTNEYRLNIEFIWLDKSAIKWGYK